MNEFQLLGRSTELLIQSSKANVDNIVGHVSSILEKDNPNLKTIIPSVVNFARKFGGTDKTTHIYMYRI